MAAEVVIFGIGARPSGGPAYAPACSLAWDPLLVAVDAANR